MFVLFVQHLFFLFPSLLNEYEIFKIRYLTMSVMNTIHTHVPMYGKKMNTIHTKQKNLTHVNEQEY